MSAQKICDKSIKEELSVFEKVSAPQEKEGVGKWITSTQETEK